MSTDEDRQTLLEFLKREKAAADRMIERNTADGFPGAVPGWQEKSDQVARWIDLVESTNV